MEFYDKMWIMYHYLDICSYFHILNRYPHEKSVSRDSYWLFYGEFTIGNDDGTFYAHDEHDEEVIDIDGLKDLLRKIHELN